jgi:hypothetical protein
VKLDTQDHWLLEWRTWTKETTGYYRARIGGKMVSLHRLLMGCKPGDGKIVDHINRDRSDNRRANLRMVDASLSSRNRRGFSQRGMPKGVYPNGNRFSAKYSENRKQIYIGTFDTPEEAYQAYLDATEKLSVVQS